LKREHLIECPHCAAELEALEQFLAESELPATVASGEYAARAGSDMDHHRIPGSPLDLAGSGILDAPSALTSGFTPNSNGPSRSLTMKITSPSPKTREAARASFLNSRNLSKLMK
jgi:hypothetical protein